MENQSQSKKNFKKFKKGIDKLQKMWYNISVLRERDKKISKGCRLPKCRRKRYSMNAREFHNAILNADVAEELKAYSKAELEKLDARNAKRKNTPTKAQVANEPIKTALYELVAAAPNGLTASVAAEKMGEGVSTQKASALLGQLATAGKLTKSEVKVKGKGKQVLYTVANADEDEGE